MKLRTAPARLAHLPTVWTDGVAGLVLAGGGVLDPATLPLLLALSLLYLADPDVRGSGRAVLVGLGMIAAALLILLTLGLALPDGTGPWPALGGAALALLIPIERGWQERNPLRPLVAALRRPLGYLTAGLVVTTALPAPLLLGTAAILSFLIGLVYVTRQGPLERAEDLWPLAFLTLPVVYGGIIAFGTLSGVVIWLLLLLALGAALRFLHRRRPGDVGRAASILIAAIALLDALLIAGAGDMAIAWLTLCGFPLTLALQRGLTGP